jgi:hypothetical protein
MVQAGNYLLRDGAWCKLSLANYKGRFLGISIHQDYQAKQEVAWNTDTILRNSFVQQREAGGLRTTPVEVAPDWDYEFEN